MAMDLPDRPVRPDALTLAGFAAIVLMAGGNLVAVRLSNRELPPFYGAGIRFLVAALLMFAYMGLRRIPPPKGREMVATLIYGVLGFAGFYAFGYWALVTLPAGIAGVLSASVPLMTVVFAALHGLEPVTVRNLAGSLLAIAGIGLMIGSPSGGVVSAGAVVAILAAAACDAEAVVVVKMLPTGDPVAANAVAMTAGAAILFVVSLVAGERWAVPSDAVTIWTLVYLVVLGSIVLFVVYLRTVKRWTASGVSYMFVLMPVVAAVLGSLVVDEPVTPGLVLGGLTVLAGVYVGALARPVSTGAGPP